MSATVYRTKKGIPQMTAIQTFKARAPWYMSKLIDDFGFSVLDAAAIMGNAGHESGGFTHLQELKPTIKGSRGGFGIFQWTGPRRVAFESYCARNKLDPRSDLANYKFLYTELKGSEKRAVAKTKAAKGLEAKVKAFELAFERAGVKHYASRNTWAKRALEAWNASAKEAIPAPAESKPAPVPTPVTPKPTPAETVGAGAAAGGAAVVAAKAGFDWWLVALIAVIAGVAALIIIKAVKD